ncbi:MAG: CaiB/BaiF CoA transferase family protein [bacterium]
MTKQAAPLGDIRVLDLSRVLAGPYCTMMLADLGAEVIKVERPDRGDGTRQWGPPWVGGESAYYLSVNRNKKSITVNLKSERGREIVRGLAYRADVLVENFLVGTMEGWGLSYELLKEHNEGLIYCAITGYGQDGPYSSRAGYDFVIQAQGGIMSITGPVEGPPMKVGVAIVDITAALYATTSILAALHERERSQQGQYIDIALLDSQIAWLANAASNYLISGERPGRYGNAHPNIVPYEPFPTSDGWLALGVGNDHQWQRLCRVAGWHDLGADPRFATNPRRVEHRRLLVPVLRERFRNRSSEEWYDMLVDAGIPCGPINYIDQVFGDPQVLARNMLVELAHPTAETVKLAGSPLKLSRTPVRIQGPPPLLGEHTEDVLAEHLGYSSIDLKRLRDQGAI